MNSSDHLNKVYVINLFNRPDRWHNVQNAFTHTGISLTRWNATSGQHLSDSYLRNSVTPFCYYFCPRSAIGIWFSHYRLWKHIVHHKYSNVLILEDDAYPSKHFLSTFSRHFPNVPPKWDFLFLGCYGSADYPQLFNAIVFQGINKPVFRHGQRVHGINIPRFPLALHGYMLSYKGAKKLLDSHFFDKPFYHLDGALNYFFRSYPNFHMYAFSPPIIFQNFSTAYSDNQSLIHPLFSSLASHIYVSPYKSLSCGLFAQLLHLNYLDVSITYFSLFLFVFTIIFSLSSVSHSVNNSYKLFISSLFFLEFLLFHSSCLKGIVFELFVVFLIIHIVTLIKHQIA